MGKTNVVRWKFEDILNADIDVLMLKQEKYGDSWRKRGGVSAFDNLCRKWDRIWNAAENHGWDIFKALAADSGPDGLIDDIRDLRNYLTLVEEHMIAQGVVSGRAPEGYCADIAARNEPVCSECQGDEQRHKRGGVDFPCPGGKRIVKLAGHMVLDAAKLGLRS